MSYKYSRNSNLLSSKNVIFNKHIKKQKELNPKESSIDLSDKHLALIQQLDVLEKQHEQILAQAESDKQKILNDAKRASIDIEKNAYEDGYSQGLKNGYEDGYKEAYNKALEETEAIVEAKIKEATEILLSSKSILTDYAMDNKSEILNLAVSIAEQVLAKEIEKSNSMDAIFENAILEIKDKKSLVIKINPKNKESMENKINALKDELSLTDDIHIISLSSVEEGDVIIESENGTILAGISVALENIKAELL